ncbi:MAG TPA: MFS transporter [Phycisphaerae bacterium]|nr:MFS transporter [Phycisphaerae bacterium]
MPPARIRLGVMMFLQYAIWGVWAPILGLHLASLDGFRDAAGLVSQSKIGLIYMTMPIASIIAPFFGGQIADRWFASQRFLAVSHFLGGIILLVVARLTGYAEVFVGMLIYNLLYAPTIALTNSIVFHHWPNDKFSQIRVWGSIGWIVIGWAFGAWLGVGALGDYKPAMGDCLYFAAAISFVLGFLSLMLPHTPPSKKPGRPWAFIDAFALMKNPAFAAMAIVAFFVAAEMQCYFVWTQSFLEKGLELPAKWIPRVLTLGQICEMAMMLLLPLVLRRLGFRVTMALGIAAWALRDFVFSIGEPKPLVIGAVALHGVGFAFFFTTIFMFADAVAPKDIKASAQSFLASVTIGLGMLVGSLSAGINDYFQGNWHKTFLVPAILCTVCCVAFLLFFRPKVTQEPAADR